MEKFGFSLKWMAVSCFEMRFGDFTVVTDPFITACNQTDLTWENIEACDAICLSHAHWDHITDIPALVEKFRPNILCGDHTAYPMASWLNYYPTFIHPMTPDLELDFGAVKIRALYGRHINLKRGYNDLMDYLDSNVHCKRDPGIAALQGVGSMEYRNYLFTLPNGTKILIWGNTPDETQTRLCRSLQPDVAIIQRSSNSKGIAQKAKFAADIGCKVVIPHHHDFGSHNPAVIEEFRNEYLKLVPDGRFVSPDHGEWVEL